jgi:hypothetical protein
LGGRRRTLADIGQVDGRNALFDVPWTGPNVVQRRYARELVALAPDVILVNGTTATQALRPTVTPQGGLGEITGDLLHRRTNAARRDLPLSR